MSRNKQNVRTDIAFIGLLVLIFIYFVFLIYQQEYLLDNFIIACVVFIVVLITYFTSLTTGLIINAVMIFTYITFVIYQSLTRGMVIHGYTYFWIVMSPALTTVMSVFSSTTVTLQREVNRLHKQLSSLSTLDEVTKLKNLRAFENDANLYMKIADRYETDFGVLVLGFRYQREIERLTDDESMKQIISMLTEAIRSSLRTEDELYQIDNRNILFGVLLLTNKESADVIRERLRNDISKINTNEILNTKNLELEVRIGITFHNEGESPLDLINQAKDAMQYDV